MVVGSPCACITQTGNFLDAQKSRSASSNVNPETSLTKPAPAATAAFATAALRVSIEIGLDRFCDICLITGTVRSISTSLAIRSAPGRVDSPPTSMISAPALTISRASLKALSLSANCPPSEKLSRVTFRMPMTFGVEKDIPMIGGLWQVQVFSQLSGTSCTGITKAGWLRLNCSAWENHNGPPAKLYACSGRIGSVDRIGL